MRTHAFIRAALVASAILPVHLAAGQPAGEHLSMLEMAVACAPPPVIAADPGDAVRVVGAEDTVPRALLDGHDLVVLDNGGAKGIALGQEFYVRRRVTFAMFATDHTTPRGVHTAGWIRIVATDDGRSIASVEHACGPILQGDYLEPFTPPIVPANITQVDTAGDPDFQASGHIVFGDDEHQSAGVGDFVIIDKGTDQGLASGGRLAIFRGVSMWWLQGLHGKQPELPLAAVGEAVVVTAAPTLSVVRITAGLGAIYSGDLVAPRK